MLTQEDIVATGRIVWDHLAVLRQKSAIEWITSAIATLPALAESGDKQAPYRKLRRLAEVGFPGTRQGEEREVKRYGKVRVQRPWLWRLPDGGEAVFEEWAKEIRAKPAKVGPYAAIESRLRDIEARLATLEAPAS